MDSKNSIINEIKNYVPFMNEEFLTSITNKGIYKRSIRDLEKIKNDISLSLTETNDIEIKFEEIKVTLNKNLQNSKCSCPSQSLCKHVIISMLYLKSYYENSNDSQTLSDTEITQSNNIKSYDYEELKSLTQDTVLDIIGKKDFNSLVSSILVKNEAEFEYNELLTVYLKNQNIKVYFPKKDSIKNSVCSCKEKNFCKHKAYALVSYLINELKANISIESNSMNIGESENYFLEKLNEYIDLIFDTGLSSLTDIELKRIEKFYIQSYGMKFFEIASSLKSLLNELNFYFIKNVSFSNKRILHILCNIYNRTTAILHAKNDIKKKNILIGKATNESFNLDNINLMGLGCACRVSKGNDLVISAYFYCEEVNSILVMSTLRPMKNTSVNPKYLYNANIVWSGDVSFKTISSSKMVLKNAKLTTGRISNTKATICNIKSKTTIGDVQNIIISDYSILKEKIRNKSFQYFEPYSESNNIFIVKVEKIKNVFFDKVIQKLKFNTVDSFDNNIEFEIKYDDVSKEAINYMENNKNEYVFKYVLGSIYEKNNKLEGTFLGGFDDNYVKNIFFKSK